MRSLLNVRVFSQKTLRLEGLRAGGRSVHRKIHVSPEPVKLPARHLISGYCWHLPEYVPTIHKARRQPVQRRFSAQQKTRGNRKKENEPVIDLRAVHQDRLDPLGLSILVMPQGFSRFQAFRDHASQRVTFFPLKLQQVFQGT